MDDVASTQDGKSFPYIVGLTGGIGSGKSTVAHLFAKLGADIIDADQVARDVVATGSPALQQIAGHFGPDILNPDQSLNRPALRQIIFEDPAEKRWLEQLLHPLIRQQIRERAQNASGPYAIIMAPLLLENGGYDFVDRILVVDLPEALQVARASRRDISDSKNIEAIMATQLGRQERLARADDVIDNSGPEKELMTQVQTLHDFYREQARHH